MLRWNWNASREKVIEDLLSMCMSNGWGWEGLWCNLEIEIISNIFSSYRWLFFVSFCYSHNSTFASVRFQFYFALSLKLCKNSMKLPHSLILSNPFEETCFCSRIFITCWKFCSPLCTHTLSKLNCRRSKEANLSAGKRNTWKEIEKKYVKHIWILFEIFDRL